MVSKEAEERVEHLTDLFLDFTDRLLVEQFDFRIEQLPDFVTALTRPNRPPEFQQIQEMLYPSFGRHEWEAAIPYFQIFAEYWDVIAVGVLAPTARDIAQEELKAAYRWVRGRVTSLIERIRGRYIQAGMTDCDEAPRFDDLRDYVEKGLGLLERTGMNNFTVAEFAGAAGLGEDLARPLLIMCQFHEENGRWTRLNS